MHLDKSRQENGTGRTGQGWARQEVEVTGNAMVNIDCQTDKIRKSPGRKTSGHTCREFSRLG